MTPIEKQRLFNRIDFHFARGEADLLHTVCPVHTLPTSILIKTLQRFHLGPATKSGGWLEQVAEELDRRLPVPVVP